MKRTLSLILAALLLAFSLTACGEGTPKETEKGTDTIVTETKAPETSTPETNAPATDSVETEAPAPTYSYDTSLITENGAAKAHIVVPNGTSDGADELLGYAAQELNYHIKLVSGVDVTVTNAAGHDSLPIIIATPDTLPELEELFPEDLAWLRDLGNPDEDVRWGDDGFAIRQHDGKFYIFGATARGALNGVYDFIEDNMGVLWIRANEEIGLICDEMPTVEIVKADYREKSPFQIRGWTYENNLSMSSTEVFYSRNKLNTAPIRPLQFNESYPYDAIGMEPFITNHNITWWLTNSPSFDPECTEYWSTDVDGNHVSQEDSEQVNIWSDLVMQCIADHVLQFIEAYSDHKDFTYIGICMEDMEDPNVYPEKILPFEYAPGQFVDPDATNFIPTVYFTMLNKIAKIVGEKYPDVIFHTYVYDVNIVPPACDLEPNVYATICPINEDLLANFGESEKDLTILEADAMRGWLEKTPNAQVYNYYGCFTAAPLFERPIWDRIRSDLQMYAEHGFNGLMPEGVKDTTGGHMRDPVFRIINETRRPYLMNQNAWNMNAMTYWLYSKLAWNPNEDVDALIQYYCDKVYGDAADEMLAYYELLEAVWNEGRELMAAEYNCYYEWNTTPDAYWLYFFDIELDEGYALDLLRDALHKAYDAADEKGKEHLKYKVEIIDNAEMLFLD